LHKIKAQCYNVALGGTFMIKIYKTKFFSKWQSKSSKLDNSSLIRAIEEMSNGLFDANLGGNLYKKRVAKKGFGKRSSYRTIIATKFAGVWIFIYGFSKNELDNISQDDLHDLKDLAHDLLSVPLDKLDKIVEVIYEK